MITKKQFLSRINGLPKTISSKTKTASYTGFKLKGDSLSFQRLNTGKIWRLSIDELYYVYKTHTFINTTIVKETTLGRVNSPSVAILMAIGCINNYGNRIV